MIQRDIAAMFGKRTQVTVREVLPEADGLCKAYDKWSNAEYASLLPENERLTIRSLHAFLVHQGKKRGFVSHQGNTNQVLKHALQAYDEDLEEDNAKEGSKRKTLAALREQSLKKAVLLVKDATTAVVPAQIAGPVQQLDADERARAIVEADAQLEKEEKEEEEEGTALPSRKRKRVRGE